MPIRRSWKELRPGLLAGAVVAALAGAILLFARVGALHGDTFRLYVAVEEARQLIRGSPVWFNGQKIGLVERIGFRPPSADTTHRVLIELQMLEEFRGFVRRDAPVQIRSGGSLIGAPVVYFGEGNPRTPPVRDGDTIIARARLDLEAVTSEFGAASQQLPTIVNNMKLLSGQLKSAEGTLGALGMEQEGTPLQAARASAARIGARLSGGRGTLGLAMGAGGTGTGAGAGAGDGGSGRGGLVARAKRAMAQADSVRALLAAEDGTSLGRFRRDSTLLREVSSVRDELSIIQSLLAEPRGSAGRFVRDSALTQELAGVQREMSALFADIKAHPLRYVRF